MLQAKDFDFIIGIDIHIVDIPAPPSPPVPTPIPMPHLGVIFDPLGVAIGSGISQAISGHPGIVKVNGLYVANCGTNATNKISLPHMFAPGTRFTMGTPMGNAELYFGSNNVSLAGSFGVRLGDRALTCSDPVRLPTSTVLALPAGRPFLNLKPMVPDIQTIAMAAVMRRAMRGLRRMGGAVYRIVRRVQQNTRLGTFIGEGVKRAIDGAVDRLNASRFRDCINPSRLRSSLKRAACHLTGHPVDVATGRVLTDSIDFELPGPLPLKFERNYDSSLSFRDGPLGYGWSHSLSQAVWQERKKLVYQDEEGREVEFFLHDLPDKTLGVGKKLYHPAERLTLKNLGEGRYEIEDHTGVICEFGPVEGRQKESPLLRRRTKDGHTHELVYDHLGRLEAVFDSAGRKVGFQYDDFGRMTEILLSKPEGEGRYRHRRLVYSEEGDLIEVFDSAGESWMFDYDGHLLVQETDRNGLSFNFQYDWRGPFASCVRTWGDKGIYDHKIDYDKHNRRTIVENGELGVTRYDMNRDGVVVRIVDPHGNVTEYEYDEETLQVTAETDGLGRTTRRSYDERGNLVSVTAPDGATVYIEYDYNQAVRAIDTGGGEWRWEYDSLGHLASATFPTGEKNQYEWESGLLRAVVKPGERRAELRYDKTKNLIGIRFPNNAETSYDYDGLGRVIRAVEPPKRTVTTTYDLEGRLVELTSPMGFMQRMSYDAEGNMLELRNATRHVQYRYDGFNKVIEHVESGTSVRFELDTEEHLTAVINEAGERYEFEYEATGFLRSETSFDGQQRYYFRDAANQVTKVLLPGSKWTHLTYDEAGRIAEVKHFDGTSETYEYGPLGFLVRGANDDVEVLLERDALGRVVREQVRDVTVTLKFDGSGSRVLMKSSLGARQAVLYDELGEVESLHHGPIAAFWRSETSFERGSLGAELSRELPGGIRVAWSYDASGKPTSRRTLKSRPGAHPVELSMKTYKWRGEDQIESIIDAARGPRWFDHDDRGRLIRERRPGPSPIQGDIALNRAMDAVGNIFRSPGLSDRVYATGGRLKQLDGIEYEHDLLGNVTKKTKPDGSVWEYRWGGNGLLKEVIRPDGKHVGFEYDVFARRTKKTVFTVDESTVDTLSPRLREGMGLPPLELVTYPVSETTYVWDGHTIIHELSSEEGLTTWYWEPGTFTPVAKERGERQWAIASDHLGTPTEMYDSKGRLVWAMELDIYGKPVFSAGSARDCPFRWPGQHEDNDINLYYNWFRFYDPDVCGYISVDPVVPGMLLSRYLYVNNPLTMADPAGLHVVEAFLNGSPIMNPRPAEPSDPPSWWENENGSGRRNRMSQSGYGREGDSENRLMEHLRRQHKRGEINLKGSNLEIVSLGNPRIPEGAPPWLRSPMKPCPMCNPGLQRFADRYSMTITYRHGEETIPYKGKGCS